MLSTRNPSDPVCDGATSPLASRRRGGFWLTYRGYRGRSAPIFNRTRRRVRRGRGHFCGREPVDQSKKGFLADLPPGNRLRFQANLTKGVRAPGKQSSGLFSARTGWQAPGGIGGGSSSPAKRAQARDKSEFIIKIFPLRRILGLCRRM